MDIKTFLLLLFNRIAECCPSVKHIDRWNNQLITVSEEQVFDVPAVFIETATAWKTKGKLHQDGETTVTLHIVSDILGDSYHGSKNQTEALKIYDVETEVYEALQGWSCGYFTPLERTGSVPDTNYEGLDRIVVTYTTTITDKAADRTRHRQTVELTPKVEGEVGAEVSGKPNHEENALDGNDYRNIF